MHYSLFLIYITILGGVLPVIYLFLARYKLNEYYFTINIITDNAILRGNIYTILSIIALWSVAYYYKPNKLEKWQIQRHFKIYNTYKKELFIMALIALAISIILSLIFGMNTSNLTAQRPPLALYTGYLSRILVPSVLLFVGYQLMLFGRFHKSGWFILILILVDLSTSWSRSGLMNIVFLFLFANAYNVNNHKIRFMNFFMVSVLGIIGIIAGQYFRTGEFLSIFNEILLRFYVNNSALYLGMTDHEKLFTILTVGQPWVMIDQLFSFIRERALMPSSFRLLEFWGGQVIESESGHIAGYAYGWLGLSYGLLKWWGILLITGFFALVFKLLRNIYNKPSFSKMVLFFFTSNILLEFFGNLGMDSFVEKIFKGLISVLVFVVISKLLIASKRNISSI